MLIFGRRLDQKEQVPKYSSNYQIEDLSKTLGSKGGRIWGQSMMAGYREQFQLQVKKIIKMLREKNINSLKKGLFWHCLRSVKDALIPSFLTHWIPKFLKAILMSSDAILEVQTPFSQQFKPTNLWGWGLKG